MSDTISSKFLSNCTERDTLISRGEEQAKLTIPYLFMDGESKPANLHQPFQSVGASGVNTLANKMTQSLLPPNESFVKFTVDDITLEEISQEEGKRSEVEEVLSSIERSLLQESESKAYRNEVFTAILLLIVTGNALIYMDKDTKSFQVYSLYKYKVARDVMGNVVEIVTEDNAVWQTLPDDVKQKLTDNGKQEEAKSETDLPIYTRIYKEDNGKFSVEQECGGVQIKYLENAYSSIEKLPWVPLRWMTVAGENYGHGLVESLMGDLISLEAVSQALVEASAISAKVVFMVKPGTTTKANNLAKAKNGGFVIGNADDVSTLQVEKRADLQTSYQMKQDLSLSLAKAFLDGAGSRRDAERVTAEEIRFIAKELEANLGGTFGIIAKDFQVPYYNYLMETTENVPKLPEEIKPQIVTGIQALGRGQDVEKLDLFIARAANLGQEAMTSINMDDLLSRYGSSIGIDTKGLIKSQDDIRQEQLLQQAQDGMVQVAGNAAMNAVDQAQGQPQE